MAKTWRVSLFTFMGFIIFAGGVIVWAQEQLAATHGSAGDNFLPVVVLDGEATAVPTPKVTPTVTPCSSPPPPPIIERGDLEAMLVASTSALPKKRPSWPFYTWR